jgi:hypothetical protein
MPGHLSHHDIHIMLGLERQTRRNTAKKESDDSLDESPNVFAKVYASS